VSLLGSLTSTAINQRFFNDYVFLTCLPNLTFSYSVGSNGSTTVVWELLTHPKGNGFVPTVLFSCLRRNEDDRRYFKVGAF
jgi:hypothetical protein